MNALATIEREPRQLVPTFKPNPKQIKANELIFKSAASHILLYGGSRSGKTLIEVRAVVQRALRAPGSRHAIWRKHFNHAKHAIGGVTFPKVMQLCWPQMAWLSFDNEGICVLPNASEIWLAGMDDADRVEKILGLEFATNMFNEISTLSYHAVEIGHSRLAQRATVTLDADMRAIPEANQYELPLLNLYDMNPVGRRHWSNKLFIQKIKPDGGHVPVNDPDDYVALQMNPEDNRENLPAKYFEVLDGMSERKRKRFRDGDWQNDVEGALWNDTMLDAARIGGLDGQSFTNRTDFEAAVEPLVRVVIGVDPSGSRGKNAEPLPEEKKTDPNDIGIVVCGLGVSGLGYVLQDGTINAAPGVWAKRVVDLFDAWEADRVAAERNFGGAMVESTLRTARDTLPITLVTSSLGKAVRAEPIAALYEPNQRKVKHAGYFDELEDQMCAILPMPVGYTGEGSPDRLDAAVFSLTELMLGSAYNLSNLD
jgi:hypothetical protein